MAYYNYEIELAELESQYHKRYANSGEIKTARMWNNQSWGSAECAATTWDSILSAYSESKICDEWN